MREIKKILFVVHRYPPFQGGSENQVRDIAEELQSRGHDIWVLAGEHKGDRNGVHLTSDFNKLLEFWDLIIVFGGDVGYQNTALFNAKNLKSPILQLLILPSESQICLQALSDVKYLGCDTDADWAHVIKHNVLHKARNVKLSVNQKISIGVPGFKERFNIKTKKMFLTSGGYWPNKAIPELVEIFNSLNLEDTTLVVTGYDNRYSIMPKESEFVKPFLLEDRNDVLSAMVDSDLYLLHSFSEGFGLVLLECMLNNTSWISRNIAGAATMKCYGAVYNTDEELKSYLKNFDKLRPNDDVLKSRRNYVLESRLAKNTADDILKIINEDK
jgi:glycosyltransferase involved in cell wall biosynthesis